MIDQLTEETRNCFFNQSVPEMLHEHARAIVDLKKRSFAITENVRARINQKINEIEELASSQLEQLEHKLHQ